MNDQDKITSEEMQDLFGDRIPIEAVRVLFQAPSGWTVGQVRAKVRSIAKAQKAAGVSVVQS